MDNIDFAKIDFKNLSEKQAKEYFEYLSEKIKLYDHEYYVNNNSLISDAEYDILYSSLEKLEKNFSYLFSNQTITDKVSGGISSKFKKIDHKKQMLSLSNVFSEDEFDAFITRAQNYLKTTDFFDIFAELKIDGLSFSARYENGKLIYAATRGDGKTGEDITENIKTIKNFPHDISFSDEVPKILEVRGEIFITKEDFVLLNQSQESQSKPLFSNPRNAASGSLRQLDSNITASRPLKYFVYALGEVSEEYFYKQQDIIQNLHKFGFEVCEINMLCKNTKEISSFYEYILSIRQNLPFEIDGIVLKINNLGIQERLGVVGKSPRYATAYKFPSMIGSTILKSISVQVGRTGALTPVANLEPIVISGVKISRATLHNFNEINRLGLKIGDSVFLERAGDVIPKIKSVDLTKRQTNFLSIKIPNTCPSCNSFVIFEDEEAVLRCENGLICPAQRKERLIHFVSKKGMNIDGLGKKQIEFLLDKKYIEGPEDIYNIIFSDKIDNLSKEENWGILSVNNLINSIENSKNTSFERFLYSLGIRHIGENNAKLLAKYFISIGNFLSKVERLLLDDECLLSEINSIDGIGSKTVISLKEFFQEEKNIIMIKNLSNILNIKDYESNFINNSFLSGKTVVFTGSLEKISRSEVKNLAERYGAKVSNSVSKNTDLIVAGADAGSKLKKAIELGIKIISEEELFNKFKELEI